MSRSHGVGERPGSTHCGCGDRERGGLPPAVAHGIQRFHVSAYCIGLLRCRGLRRARPRTRSKWCWMPLPRSSLACLPRSLLSSAQYSVSSAVEGKPPPQASVPQDRANFGIGTLARGPETPRALEQTARRSPTAGGDCATDTPRRLSLTAISPLITTVTPLTIGAPSTLASRVVAEQHHRNSPRRHDDVRAGIDKAPGLALEYGLQLRLLRRRCESVHVVADVGVDGADACDPLLQPVAMNLLGVGRYEGWVDRSRGRLCGLWCRPWSKVASPRPRTGIFTAALASVQADVLEVVHEEDVIAVPLGRNGRHHRRTRKAEILTTRAPS